MELRCFAVKCLRTGRRHTNWGCVLAEPEAILLHLRDLLPKNLFANSS